MTTMNSSHLILLDLQNVHNHFESIFDTQLFRRFTNRLQCLDHISSRQTTIRLLHVFLPQSEHTIIDNEIIFFNTIYYIYCLDQESLNQMKQQYKFPMFVKIFDVNSLSTYLHQAAMAHSIEQAERTKHEPDEHDIALQTAAELAEQLARELHQHMIGV